MAAKIETSTLKFLKELKANNNREWFNENKKRYQAAHENVIAFADELLDALSAIDQIATESGKKSLFRIYRDVRFSKDKAPYKTSFSGGFRRATAALRGGYYFSIAPGESMVGGGFWGPNAEDIKLIRSHIAAEPERLRSIITSEQFRAAFGQLDGEQVKTAPKGYSKDHPAIDLLRYKQFLVGSTFTDAQVTSSEFTDIMVGKFQDMRPFFDYMSEILTTDLNGISLIQ